MTEDKTMRSVREVQQIVQDYASYSQSKNGLGTALGGLIGIIVYLINIFSGHSNLVVVLTIGLAACWLIGKEIIRRRLYRSFGEAQEVWSAERRRSHLISVSIVTLLMFGVWLFFLLKLPSTSWNWFALLFTFLILAISPWVMWRYLRTLDEFVIGVFLLVVCIVTSVGNVFQPGSIEGLLGTFLFPLTGLGMILKGLKEHLDYRKLVARLAAQEERT